MRAVAVLLLAAAWARGLGSPMFPILLFSLVFATAGTLAYLFPESVADEGLPSALVRGAGAALALLLDTAVLVSV